MKERLICAALTLIILSGFLFPGLFLTVARAQAPSLSPGAMDLLRQAPPKQSYQDAGAVILLREAVLTVGERGLCTRRLHVVGKILDDRAASQYGQIIKGYNSFYEDASLVFARTLTADGAVMKVAEDAVQVKTLPDKEKFSDIRILTFSLPGLAKGAAFEYEIMIREKTALIEGNWFDTAGFHSLVYGAPPRADPVYKSRYVLDVPEGLEFLFRLARSKAVPTRTTAGGRTVYTWEVSDLLSIAMETNMPPPRTLGPMIYVSSLRTWRQVSDWAGSVILPAVQVTPAIEAKAREVTKGLQTEEQKIAALFYFVEENIEYVGADINRGGFKPHPAPEVLRNRYGDCKDQAVLLTSLLRALKIEAHPALVETYSYDEIHPEVPSPMFPHIIVYVPGKGDGYWLDTTAALAPFPYLPWPDSDRPALVIGKEGILRKTPPSKAGDTRGKIEARWSFKGPDASLALTAEATGDFAIVYKKALKALAPDQRKQKVIDFANHVMGKPGKVGAVDLPDTNSPRLPYRSTVNLEFPNSYSASMATYSCPFGVAPLFTLVGGFHDLPQKEYRKNDYVLPFPFSLTFEHLCEPPARGMKPRTIPSNESKENPFFSFRVEHQRNGDGVRTIFTFVPREKVIKKEQYGAFYQDMVQILNKSYGEVVFTANKGSIEEADLEETVKKEPSNSRASLDLSRKYLARGKYKDARDLLAKALLADPNSGEAHYFLGIACGYLDLRDESKKAFSRAKELGYKP